MSPDNRKYDEETRAQSAERHATLIVRTVQSVRARLIRETRRDKSRHKKDDLISAKIYLTFTQHGLLIWRI